MMKKSIKWKLFMVLTAVIIFMVAIFGALNTLVLERYYFFQKTRFLIGAWDKINRFYQDHQLDVELELEKLSANNGATLFIADSEFNVIYRSVNRPVILFRTVFPAPAYSKSGTEPEIRINSQGQIESVSAARPDSQGQTESVPQSRPDMQIKASQSRPDSQPKPAPGGVDDSYLPVDVTAISSARFSSNGFLVERRHDERLNFEYLQLAGKLDNGYYLFAQIAVDPIRESVQISNQFLMISALITLIIGAGLILAVSRSFTRPILTLSSIARKMSQLDFTQSYEGIGEDELNTLGQSINAMSRQLEQKIIELQKTNRKLQLEIDYISEIDETRQEFISNLSHELKTPLALIQGYAEGLRDNVIQDEENKVFYCDVILDEAEKTGALVKKLLNLIQMEFGSNELLIQSFDMTQLIQSLLKKHKVLFDSKGVRVCFEQEEPAPLRADEYLLEEVLNNYLTNAVNHAAGEKEIRIWTELQPGRGAGIADAGERDAGSRGAGERGDAGSRSAGERGARDRGAGERGAGIAEAGERDTGNQGAGERLRVSVFNTGAPILEQDMLKIWDSFYKADKARTREYGGNGLGLAVVKAAILRHHGLYGVDNVEGGVVFWFELEKG
ncbi:MAG: HAMP domain-containing histidine kinase [Peptococcaceae bacterium]|jgi:signal transduction histidine kinase|nr:HAMP domain-containing histidine kinase [Peptococcaceae bacterium]